MSDDDPDSALLCSIGTRICALPIRHVFETMRQLPVERAPGAPAFVAGLAMVRGEPIPVIDLARLLGADAVPGARWVTISTEGRRIALAVQRVLGVRSISAASLSDLPPLLQNADAEFISAVGTLDNELLLVLNDGRLLPERCIDASETAQLGMPA